MLAGVRCTSARTITSETNRDRSEKLWPCPPTYWKCHRATAVHIFCSKKTRPAKEEMEAVAVVAAESQESLLDNNRDI